MDAKIIAALIAAAVSLVVSIANAVFGRRNQRDLESLRSRLAETRAERDARRDYEYDARKRLYEECEPLFFQANEAAENTTHRILSLARTSRIGKLGSGCDSWVSRDGYYFRSTLYKLLAPLAIFKQLQRRLTLVDLGVDSVVLARYELMKWLYLTYTDDYEFARIEPAVEYAPDETNAPTKRKQEPAKYWKQGIAWGYLDNAVESLLVREKDETPRAMSFGEFERAYSDESTSLAKAFSVVADVFVGFEPTSRPVLWRMLVTQAHLCNAIVRAGHVQGEPSLTDFRPLQLITSTDREPYVWLPTKTEVDRAVVSEPFNVARAYLERHLPSLLDVDVNNGLGAPNPLRNDTVKQGHIC